VTVETVSPLAVVTGASRGLGETIATYLSGEGYRLILTARGTGPLEEVVQRLRRGGSSTVYGIAGDVNDRFHRVSVREKVIALGGGLSLLVNNASELGPSPLPPLAAFPLEDLDRIYRTNVISAVGLVQELLAPLEEAHGRVVNISSDAALGGYPGWGGYGASKAALDLVTRTLANELKDRGVAVTSVDPGDLRTAMHQAAFPGESIDDRPLPEVTLPFWAWLLHQDPARITGQRFRAQADRWELPA
jgi:NAD(P)-dependent dehydrogenase (short-subunit alcohol dehydrogenase family)